MSALIRFWLVVGTFVLPTFGTFAHERVVSLDYCADQFVIKLVAQEKVAALSPDAVKEFSYLRKQAESYVTVRANAESVLALAPDVVVRSYGGGPNAGKFYEGLNIRVVQVGFANSVTDIRHEVLRLARELGNENKGKTIVSEMDRRLERAIATIKLSTMYITAGGVTSGTGTLMNDMIETAGHTNFEQRAGWRSIPLEMLTTRQPEQIATAFYDNTGSHRNYWSAARHPIIRHQLKQVPTVQLDGATTACGGWFLMDAIEQLAGNES